MTAENTIRELRVLFAGGGTGGHLYPAIALAEEFRRRSGIDRFSPLFVGTERGLESRVLPEMGYPLQTIRISGFHRGLSVKIFLTNLILPVKVIIAFFQTRRILNKFKPHLVVGTGGYTEAIPVFLASKRGIPTAIQEQNSYPGAVSRWLDTKVKIVFLGFEESGIFFRNPEKRFYGNPVRGQMRVYPKADARAFFGLAPEKKTVFIFGGSQGSRPLNQHFLSSIPKYLDMGAQFLWQTGRLDYEQIKGSHGQTQGVVVKDFIREMDKAYSAADFCVCRAGALSLAELSLMGKPALLVPLPSAAADHQRHNAEALVKSNAARMVLQKELYTPRMEEVMRELIESEEILKMLSNNIRKFARPDAAKQIVDDLLEIASA